MNFKLAGFGFIVALLLGATASSQERAIGVRQKLDAVFSQPVEALVPELAGATATDENGRGRRRAQCFGAIDYGDGRTAFLFACAPSEVVNCDERVQLICLDGTNVIRNSTADGTVTRRQLAPTSGVAAPGVSCARAAGTTKRRPRWPWGSWGLRLRPAGSALAGAARVTIHLLRRGTSWRSI